jgi:hypothetical protein
MCTFVKVRHAVLTAAWGASGWIFLQGDAERLCCSMRTSPACTGAAVGVTQHARRSAGGHGQDAGLGQRGVHQDAAVPGERWRRRPADMCQRGCPCTSSRLTANRVCRPAEQLEECCSTSNIHAMGRPEPAGDAVQAFYRRGEGRLVGMQMTPQKLKLLRKAIVTLAENRCGAVRHQPLPAVSAGQGKQSTRVLCCAFSISSAKCRQLCAGANAVCAVSHCMHSGGDVRASLLQGQVVQARPQRLHHSCESLLLLVAVCQGCFTGVLSVCATSDVRM